MPSTWRTRLRFCLQKLIGIFKWAINTCSLVPLCARVSRSFCVKRVSSRYQTFSYRSIFVCLEFDNFVSDSLDFLIIRGMGILNSLNLLFITLERKSLRLQPNILFSLLNAPRSMLCVVYCILSGCS